MLADWLKLPKTKLSRYFGPKPGFFRAFSCATWVRRRSVTVNRDVEPGHKRDLLVE